MESVHYENQLLNAIETIVNNAVVKAGYDKTIKAIIDKCVDAATGKYIIRYQDGTFEAWAADINVSYSKGTLVQVLVPGNDMTQNKTIIGSVEKQQVEYVSVLDPESQYEITGSNVIDTDTEYSLCSYLTEDTEVLYNRDAEINLINLDTVTFANNIINTDTIICGAEFRTALDSEQSSRGDFGIAFEIDFKDNISGDIVTKTYVVDVNQMTGNPYNQVNFTRQFGIFGVNGKNFDSVKQIYIFSKNFPNTASGKAEDLFFRNFELVCAEKLTEEELINYSLSVITDGKNYFNNGDVDSDTITLIANFRIRGVLATSSTPGVEYYWFKENASITKNSLNYCNYGGEGWECLNRYNVVNTGAESKTWIGGSSSFIVHKADISAGQAIYKCVVVHNTVNTTEDSIELFNYDTLYNIEIYSDQGDTFYYDNGNPTLSLLVNGSVSTDTNFTYQWAVVDNNNSYTRLLDTDTANTEYNNAKAAYDTLVANIASGAIMPAAHAAELAQYKTILDAYEDIRRVEGAVVHKAQIKDITDYSTYKCTVYYGSIYIGTAAITLTNNLNIEGLYHLEIVNGDQVFNYNAMGVSPTNESLENPIKIKPLSFKIYDNLGNELGETIYRHCDIQWTFPKENTMLRGNDLINVLSCPFEIANIYDSFKTNNNIEVTIKYKELNLKGETTFSFLKDGDPGTNGTDIVCKIVPNTTETMTAYPMLVNGIPNFTPVAEGKWFKVQLWKNGSLIFEDVTNGTSSEGISAIVEWSILKNKYTDSIEDPSAIIYDKTTNTFSYDSFQNYGANIIKCTVIYNGKYYYSMLPLITSTEQTHGYSVEVVPNKGYRYVMYSSAGKEPQYDNTYPFTLRVTKEIDGYIEDVTDSPNHTYRPEYWWSKRGRVYTSTGWVNTDNLIIENTDDTPYKNVKPSDTFDGECVTNAIVIQVSDPFVELCRLHIPIHFFLNKYGIASLNDWDGNSIDINNELGSILAPQVGAGSKNSSNQFTGVLMGKVKESSLTEKEGLFGFHNGDQTIFLDAHTGKAEFGKQGAGQIILDPTDNTAKIQSGNYVSGTSGMLIDFTTPQIKFGSGNFEVNSSGHLTAKGGGSIAGWNISNTKLSKGKVGISSDNSADTNYAFWAGNATANSAPFRVTFGGAVNASNLTVTGGSLNINNNFIVDSNGNMTAKAGYIGNGSNGWTIGNTSLYNTKASFNDTHNGVYIGTDGISLGAYDSTKGNPFEITNTGVIKARSGTIGGWTVTDSKLYATSADNKVTGLASASHSGDPVFYAGGGDPWSTSDWATSVPFYVTNKGKLHATDAEITGSITATSGRIGNWNMDGSNLRSNGYGYIYGGTLSGSYISGGAINISSNGGYLQMAAGSAWQVGAKHPTVSALNVGASGSDDASIKFRPDLNNDNGGLWINGNTRTIQRASTTDTITLTAGTGIYVNGYTLDLTGVTEIKTSNGNAGVSSNFWTGDYDNIHFIIEKGIITTIYLAG